MAVAGGHPGSVAAWGIVVPQSQQDASERNDAKRGRRSLLDNVCFSEFFQNKLPDGIELNIPQFGIENSWTMFKAKRSETYALTALSLWVLAMELKTIQRML